MTAAARPPAPPPPPLDLDANATEPLRPEARAAVLEALAVGGNPSSVHAAGRAARRLLEDARERLAARFGARPRDAVLTAGGTEANAIAVRGLGGGPRRASSPSARTAPPTSPRWRRCSPCPAPRPPWCA